MRGKCQLRWVQTQVIEDVSLARIEDAEGGVYHRVLLRRPGQTDSWRPIALVKLDACMRYRIRSIRIHYHCTLQIEVAHAAIGGRRHFVAQADVQSEVWRNVEIILYEFRQVPIARWIHSSKEVLPRRNRYSDRQGIHRVTKKAPMGIIERAARKSVGPTQANVLRAGLIATWTAVQPAQVRQRSRPKAADITEAVPREDLILFAKAMVQANVERILIIHSIRIGEIVVDQARTIGQRIQIGNIRSRRISHYRRD